MQNLNLKTFISTMICLAKYQIICAAFNIHTNELFPWQMRQNMFEEGLYQVFFKDTPSPSPQTEATNNGELSNARIHRWFGAVVNTRLLVSGVRSSPKLLINILKLWTCPSFIPYSPSGDSNPQCLSLHTNHNHSRMCELQLCCLHDNTSMVKHICESTSASADMHTV